MKQDDAIVRAEQLQNAQALLDQTIFKPNFSEPFEKAIYKP